MKLSLLAGTGLVAWMLPSLALASTGAPTYECGCGDVCYGRKPTDLSPQPTHAPSRSPTDRPTKDPTKSPSKSPTNRPTDDPTRGPTPNPTDHPTPAPIPVSVRSDTGSPTCESQDIDVCIAIDMSGSVCSDAYINSCIGCPDHACHRNETIASTQCCNNFVKSGNFAKSFIEEFSVDTKFAIVSFSTYGHADTAGNLVIGSDAKTIIDGIQYQGGLTNTGKAINYCRSALSQSPNKRVMIILSDGEPTTGAGSCPPDDDPNYDCHHVYAHNEASMAKAYDNIHIIPVTVQTGDTDMGFMTSLGSDPNESIQVGNFDELNSIVDELADMVQCTTPAPVDTGGHSLTSSPIECPPVDIDVCIAVDTSGSICSPHNAIQSCSGCQTNSGHTCNDGAEQCCQNYHMEKDYAAAIATNLGYHGGDNQVSVVLFSGDSSIQEELMNPFLAGNVLEDLDYIGGLTATADAITHCHETLKNSTKERVLVLLTDGTPTTCDGCGAGGSNSWQHYDMATRAANWAKGDDIRLIPIIVTTGSTNPYFLRTIASDLTEVQEVDEFDKLADTLGDVVDAVQCGAADSAASDWYLYSKWTFYCGDTYMYDSSGPWECRCLNDCECKYSSNWGSSAMGDVNNNAAMRIRDDGSSANLAMIDIPTYSATKMKVVFDFIANGVGGHSDNVDEFVFEWASSHTFANAPCVVATYTCCGDGPLQFNNDVMTHKELEFDFTNGCGDDGSAHNTVVRSDVQDGAKYSKQYGSFNVDYDIELITFTISGGPHFTGDADLYVAKGRVPTMSDWDCRPWYGSGSGETCKFTTSTSPSATGRTEWHWMIYGYSDFTDLDVEVVTDGDPPHLDDPDISIRFRTVNSHTSEAIYLYNAEVYLLDANAP